MKYTLEDLLNEREKRIAIQEKLIKKFNKPLLVIKANYPGLNKLNDITNNIVKSIDSVINDILEHKIYFKLLRFTAEGPVVIMVINTDPIGIKKIAIEIEQQHGLGRFADIDVYNKNNEALSRYQLGYGMRKCYICNEDAHVCTRAQKHSISDIIQYITNKYEEYMESIYEK